jgi:hypothetical protein
MLLRSQPSCILPPSPRACQDNFADSDIFSSRAARNHPPATWAGPATRGTTLGGFVRSTYLIAQSTCFRGVSRMPDVDAIFERTERFFRVASQGASSRQYRRWQANEVKPEFSFLEYPCIGCGPLLRWLGRVGGSAGRRQAPAMPDHEPARATQSRH